MNLRQFFFFFFKIRRLALFINLKYKSKINTYNLYLIHFCAMIVHRCSWMFRAVKSIRYKYLSKCSIVFCSKRVDGISERRSDRRRPSGKLSPFVWKRTRWHRGVIITLMAVNKMTTKNDTRFLGETDVWKPVKRRISLYIIFFLNRVGGNGQAQYECNILLILLFFRVSETSVRATGRRGEIDLARPPPGQCTRLTRPTCGVTPPSRRHAHVRAGTGGPRRTLRGRCKCLIVAIERSQRAAQQRILLSSACRNVEENFLHTHLKI